jgi:hypothetical protein
MKIHALTLVKFEIVHFQGYHSLCVRVGSGRNDTERWELGSGAGIAPFHPTHLVRRALGGLGRRAASESGQIAGLPLEAPINKV